MTYHKNLGKIRISLNFFRAAEKLAEITKALNMAEFLVTNAEQDFNTAAIIYTGISPKFRDLEEGEAVPVYNLFIHVDDTGQIDNVDVSENKARVERIGGLK